MEDLSPWPSPPIGKHRLAHHKWCHSAVFNPRLRSGAFAGRAAAVGRIQSWEGFLMNDKAKYGVGAAIIASSFLAPTAWPCTCGQLSVAEATRMADIVFTGRVEKVTFVDPEKAWEPRVIAVFTVDRVWKGAVPRHFVMHTNYEFSSCSGFFRELLQVGQELLVYGYGRPAKVWKAKGIDGAPNSNSFTVLGNTNAPARADLIKEVPDDVTVYTTNICTRTMPMEDAARDIKVLGHADQPAETPQ